MSADMVNKSDSNYITKIKPLDAFKPLFKTLAITGYFKPVPQLSSSFKNRLHHVYRLLTVFILIVYIIQLAVCAFQEIGDVDKLIEVLCVLITTSNVTFKVITIHSNFHRFDRINNLLNGQLFSASCNNDETFMKEAEEHIRKLTSTIYRTIAVCSTLWFVTPIINRLSNEDTTVPAYFPFSTNNWFGFVIASAWVTIMICWEGYGHMSYDCFISGYFTQARIQLKIIRYHLEHLADDDSLENDSSIDNIQRPPSELTNLTFYKDEYNEKYQLKFVSIVKRYGEVVWMTNEVESIVNKAMLMQLLNSVSVLCAVVYQITGLGFNTEILYLMLFLGCLLLELYFYCYYATLLDYESNQINDSLYLSDWLSLSPRFRRQMMIAMSRWSRPIQPSVAGLVPLSLNTCIMILRASYTLYTVLKQTE